MSWVYSSGQKLWPPAHFVSQAHLILSKCTMNAQALSYIAEHVGLTFVEVGAMRHFQNKALTSTFTSMLDMYLTEGLRSSRSQRAPEAGSSRGRFVLWGVLCLTVLGTTEVHAKSVNSTDMFKLYAHSRLIDYKQFQCLNQIITKESRWNVSARNGSHYGLGQMRSVWYRDLDGYRQIDATIAYVFKRYGSMCNAWRFHVRNNYY